MTNKKVSVILTSYNHEKYLRASIDSVLQQTFSDFDLIIWDDGSTDGSWQIIESYSDPRIRAFRSKTNQRGSPIRAVVSTIDTEELIAIHHSDDIWEPQKLEKQIAFLEKNPHFGAIFSNARIVDENGEPFEDRSHFYYSIFDQPNRSRHEWLNYFFHHGNALCHPSVLIRKRCYEDCGLYRFGISLIGDLDMWVRLCLQYEIYVLPEKLVCYRVRADEMNASGNRLDTNIQVQFEYLQVLENYKKILSFDELTKVFPVAEKYRRADDADLGYVLAMVALEAKPYKFSELFGLSLLFEAINDPIRARKIYHLYNFTNRNFVALTAEHDVFSIELITNLKSKVEALSSNVEILSSHVTALQLELKNIHNSRAWKVTQYLQRLHAFIAPLGSFREKILRLFFGG